MDKYVGMGSLCAKILLTLEDENDFLKRILANAIPIAAAIEDFAKTINAAFKFYLVDDWALRTLCIWQIVT